MKTYWFFDTALKRSTSGAKTVPGALKKDARNPLFSDGAREKEARPWETQIGNGYPNVFFDPSIGRYRCYYTCFLAPDNGPKRKSQEYRVKEDRITGIVYAESEDGIRWTKPALDVVEYGGSARNNIVALNTHGAGVLLDEAEKDPGRRYKIISRDDRGPLNIHAAFSADGIHFHGWTPVIDDPALPGDTHNFVIRDRDSGKYLLFTRTFKREMRAECRLESDDFLRWTNPRTVLGGLDADDQVYGMPVFQQDGLFWGLAEIFHTGDASLSHYDHVEIELCYSGDGIFWQRVAPGEPFLPNGAEGAYDFGTCYASAPVSDGKEYRFYYMGGSGTHYDLKETGLCLATIRKNRLAGVAPRQDDGFTYQTRRMTFGASEITLCADADGGEICYEILDGSGDAIPGFSREDCFPIVGACDDASLRWRGGAPPAGPCMLKFYCRNAILYTLSGEINLNPAHPL